MLVGGSCQPDPLAREGRARDPGPGVGTELASFDTSKFPVDLLGFGLKGKIDVILTPQGLRIPISLELPPNLVGVRGEADCS